MKFFDNIVNAFVKANALDTNLIFFGSIASIIMSLTLLVLLSLELGLPAASLPFVIVSPAIIRVIYAGIKGK